MPLNIYMNCPSGHPLKVPDKLAGHRVRCPVCDQAVLVPISRPSSPRSRAETPVRAIERAPLLVIEGAPSKGTHPDALPSMPSAALRDRPRAIAAAGSRQRRERRASVLWLGAATLGIAIVCSLPAVRAWLTPAQTGRWVASDGWSHLVLLVALIQFSLAIYSVQLPDWSSAWVTAMGDTAAAVFYAVGLAFCTLARPENALATRLGLADELFHTTAQRWCFLVLCLTLMLAYCHGRFSLRWYQTQRRLATGRT